ncbi:hypothetical protein V8C43DRAFT_300588 [Trichoderma afarasin]
MIPADFHEYVYSKPGSRGTGDLSKYLFLPPERLAWSSFLARQMNTDSGDLGLGVLSMTSYDGLRVTADSAYLSDVPSNLIIRTESPVARNLFDGKKAIGVELTSGTQYFATQETIISTGAIDSPKILLLSGIGPQDELAELGIPVTSVRPGVGNNFKDKCMVYLKAHLQPGTEEHRTGPMVVEPCRITTRYFKLENPGTFAEFQQLDKQAKQLLMRPRTTAYEIAPVRDICGSNNWRFLFRDACHLDAPSINGKISLRSSDPVAAPIIQLDYLKNPYDRRVLMESTKKMIDFIYSSKIPAVEPIVGLPGKTDEDILVQQSSKMNFDQLLYLQGTVKMGKLEDESACVGSDFRVIGIEHLRVADLSVVPVTLSTHTQASAYVTGEIAAQKLISTYGL